MPTISDVHTDRLVVHTCWCGVRHAIPSSVSRQAKNNRKSVYCPLGHSWVYRKSKAEELEEQLQRERATHDQVQARLRDELKQTEARRRGEKAAKTRLKNRAKAGVCPCCNRSFQNLRRHMETQHPDFACSED